MTITFKGIELEEEGKFVHLTITGKLEKEDYDIFVPEIDQQIKQYGRSMYYWIIAPGKDWINSKHM